MANRPLKIAILGAGPAGLYFAYLLKRERPDLTIEVFEQNPRGATFGFGLAFSARALEFLKEKDAATYAAIEPALQIWSDSVVSLNGETIRIDGMSYSGIGRLRLLEILEARATSVGIEPRYNHVLKSLDEMKNADLIVGADGANSLVRRTHEDRFGTKIEHLTNRYAWFGTHHRFEALGHSFIKTASGTFNAHHHSHSADMSTFVVEVDAKTFADCRFEEMGEGESRAVCECIFGKILKGEGLISNNSIWRRFPKISNQHWSVDNCVLLGDALHTAHFSIGSGTRLAMEDAIALADAITRHTADIPAALAAYETARKPEVAKLTDAANKSADWYEHFPEHMRLAPLDFAMSYITRSGRVDLDRLHQTSPDFVAAYEAQKRTK